ncbi:hypothetical protein STEG23_027249 [Scotinomys teguina]
MCGLVMRALERNCQLECAGPSLTDWLSDDGHIVCEPDIPSLCSPGCPGIHSVDQIGFHIAQLGLEFHMLLMVFMNIFILVPFPGCWEYREYLKSSLLHD